MMNYEVLQGDCREILKTLPEKSVNCVVTSPPYFGLRDYGTANQIGLEQTPAAYVAEMVAVFSELWRVLRDDGTAWLNLGDSYGTGGSGQNFYNPNGKRNIHSANSSFGESGHIKNIGIKGMHKQLLGIPWRVAFALQDAGWVLRSEIIWNKPNCMPESVTDRPTKSHETIFLLVKQERYFYDAVAIYESALPRHGGGVKTTPHQGYKNIEKTEYNPLGKNKRTVWEVSTAAYPGSHFATFPPKLIEPMILAGCPVGGTVLDPFAGSGTTLQIAIKNNRNAIGIELNPEYIALIHERLNGTQLKLMG